MLKVQYFKRVSPNSKPKAQGKTQKLNKPLAEYHQGCSG